MTDHLKISPTGEIFGIIKNFVLGDGGKNMAIIKEKKITVSSVIENLSPSGAKEGEAEETCAVYDGFLKIYDNEINISYTEKSEGGKIVSDITVGESFVRVKRVGAVESDMIFNETAPHSSLYTVPPYSFDVTVVTKRIRNSMTKDGGRLDIYYNMEIGGAAKCVKMRIEC